jgi:hypothetical protein
LAVAIEAIITKFCGWGKQWPDFYAAQRDDPIFRRCPGTSHPERIVATPSEIAIAHFDRARPPSV